MKECTFKDYHILAYEINDWLNYTTYSLIKTNNIQMLMNTYFDIFGDILIVTRVNNTDTYFVSKERLNYFVKTRENGN